MATARIVLATTALATLAGCMDPPPDKLFLPRNFIWMSFMEGAAPQESDLAVLACATAPGAENQGVVTVLDAEIAGPQAEVLMQVGADGTGWSCLVAPDGGNPVLTRSD